MARQYPTLFMYGEDGFHDKIPYYTNRGNRKTNRGFVTMKEYYSYIIQQRNDQGNTLVRGGRLFQRYLVDAYSVVEEQRLKWTRNNQDTLQVDLYHNVCDTVTRGDTNTAGLGQRIVLSGTFVGGPRCMMQNYQDAMAICRTYGNPYLFITFTSNPKWPEISEMLVYIPGQKAHDRPEIGTRIDDIISAELPSPTDDPDGYKQLHIICYMDLAENVRKGDHVTSEKVVAVDEINNYLNFRYLAPGPKDFDELMTVNNRLCHTFKEACFAYGQLNDDREWTKAISEASLWALGPQLRDLFVTILLFCDVSRPLKLWEETWEFLSDDILHRKRKLYDYPKLSKSATPQPQLLTNMDNRLIREALNFDMNKSGTGKTFLYNTIIARLRTERKIMLAVASSGGRTAHSRFIIPLELLENSTCDIKQNTYLAKLMQEVQLIIWDEAPMTQKYLFEALDKRLRDILGQILPAIPKGKRPDVVQSCINRSELWKHCNVFTLTQSMRVNEYYPNGEINNRKHEFNQWVLSVGNGTVPAKAKDGEDEPTWIQILEQFLIKSLGSLIKKIVAETYPNFIER
ncbi:ATP-dependent DNA helicase PIF1-like protein [Tanacetum coccineum]|uniref:ATP-dependent DNA helicase n=1 Tax=Tanacetum coccineum TaxID=301880 RepID=A0ABQ5FK62_9ASTR